MCVCVLSLLFNKLSRLVITFLPRSKHLFISWLQSPSAVILEPPKIKSVTVSTVSPIYLPWSNGTRRRKWQPIPVFLPREYHGQGSLVGCPPWSCTKSDMTEASKHACMHWRRKWKPTLVFLPGEFQGQRSLVGCHLWGRRELGTTEATYQQQQLKL